MNNFYPRPPRGGRLSHQFLCDFYFTISIHALREEGDAKVLREQEKKPKFLSTPSARRATLLSRSFRYP